MAEPEFENGEFPQELEIPSKRDTCSIKLLALNKYITIFPKQIILERNLYIRTSIGRTTYGKPACQIFVYKLRRYVSHVFVYIRLDLSLSCQALEALGGFQTLS